MSDGPVGPAVVLLNAGAQVSGAEGVLLDVAAELVRRGHRVVLACPPGPLAERRPSGVEHLPTPVLELGRGGPAVGAVRLAARSAGAARVLRPLLRDGAVLVVNTLLAVPAARLAAGGGPHAWLVHDTVHRRVQRLVVRGASRALRAVAVSEATAAPLRRLGLDVVVRPNGVRLTEGTAAAAPTSAATSAAASGPDRAPLVGCVALLTHWKGHAVLLEALAALPGVHLELAGGEFPTDAAHAAGLRERASRPDLAGRVRFLGHCDVAAALRRWDVAVSASTWPEAMPLAVLEAMEAGLPVVGTDHGGTAELLAQAGGVLVPPGDAAAMAGALRSLVADPARRAALGAAGRAVVHERYALHRTLPALVDALLAAPDQTHRPDETHRPVEPVEPVETVEPVEPVGTARRVSGLARAGLAAAGGLARRRSSTPGAAVLAFHDVLDDDAPPFDYAVSATRLRQQLDVVARLRLDVVPLSELASRILAGRSVDGLVAVVFDDALDGAVRRALPELARRGWPASLAPVTERLGGPPPWWPGSGPTADAAALAAAVRAGAHLTGHSATHDCLPCLPQAELERQLLTSRAALSDLAGRDVTELAYPFGHHDERVVAAARAAGWTTGWTFLNGRATTGADPFRLPRLTVTQQLSPARLALQLARRPADWPAQRGPAVHPVHPPVPPGVPGRQ